MKAVAIILLTSLVLFSCTTMQQFKLSDMTTDGIKYKYGSSQGVKVGETVKVFQKSKFSRGFKLEPVGSLTIIKVEPEFSIMKKNGDFLIDESMSFSKE